ncbi:cation:proton antiporter subunit C [Salinarchaeum laminariae]|uniref:cation:proton antiporter subunit C n=1 Tax=Salinarchaeum laminariae TaxID=869888 RepID=UPI0020BD8E96|nr:cation:proton antiporter subunit C [Salinarchaeum laminariae]
MTPLVDVLTSRYAYVLFALLLGIGLYMIVSSQNLVKKVIGLNLFQTALFLFFIASAYLAGGQAPIVHHGGKEATYVSPLPQVIVLTAIVVGIAVTAVALALLVRIYAEYGTLEEDVLREVRSDD